MFESGTVMRAISVLSLSIVVKECLPSQFLFFSSVLLDGSILSSLMFSPSEGDTPGGTLYVGVILEKKTNMACRTRRKYYSYHTSSDFYRVCQ